MADVRIRKQEIKDIARARECQCVEAETNSDQDSPECNCDDGSCEWNNDDD